MVKLTLTDGTPLKFMFSQFNGLGHNIKLNYYWVKVCGKKHPILENDIQVCNALKSEKERLKALFN